MTNRWRIVFLAAAVNCLLSAGCGRSQDVREVHVAAAANLREALDELSRTFESRSGIHVASTVGATAQLAQQVENGAPVDVFLSADVQHVDQLISKNMAEPRSRAVYARGRLVIWAPQHSEITTLRDLASPRVAQIGCAQPELAPYGAAAIQALKRESLWEAVGPKLVYAQSISAAKQFADSGNVAAAFTALALVNRQVGHYVMVDVKLHDPLDQALCIVKASAQPEAANRFRDFVLSDEGRAILEKYGYTQPGR